MVVLGDEFVFELNSFNAFDANLTALELYGCPFFRGMRML